MRALRTIGVAFVAASVLWPAPATARVDLLTGLIAYWSLDDATDAHGSRDLTNNNTVTFATGKVGNAGVFEASDSEYLSHADHADLSFGDEDFTIAAWVQQERVENGGSCALGNDDMTIVSKGTDLTTHEYWLRYDCLNDQYQFQIFGSSSFGNAGTASTFSNTAVINTWYFVVGWYDATANEVCIQVENGTPSCASQTGGAHDAAGTFMIGAGYPSPGRYADGFLDEVGLWGRTLTTQERTDLYNSGNGLAYPLTVGGGASFVPAIINNPIRGGGSVR